MWKEQFPFKTVLEQDHFYSTFFFFHLRERVIPLNYDDL